MSNTYSFKLHGRKWTLTPLTPTQLHELKKEIGCETPERGLSVSGSNVKRVIGKGNTILAILMVEAHNNKEVTPLTPNSAHAL